jgi:hypothetical protein
MIAAEIGKDNIVARDNAAYGISRAGTRLQPIEANRAAMADIQAQLYTRAEWLGLAAEMRAQFGLRAGESIRWQGVVVERPDGTQAIKLDRADGTKGGRYREVPIRTPEQRQLIERVRGYIRAHGQRSLIPRNMTYRQAYTVQRNALYQAGARRAAGTNAHAARHAYAQDRAAVADRATVAEELGHGREEVVSHYVNR